MCLTAVGGTPYFEVAFHILIFILTCVAVWLILDWWQGYDPLSAGMAAGPGS